MIVRNLVQFGASCTVMLALKIEVSDDSFYFSPYNTEQKLSHSTKCPFLALIKIVPNSITVNNTATHVTNLYIIFLREVSRFWFSKKT